MLAILTLMISSDVMQQRVEMLCMLRFASKASGPLKPTSNHHIDLNDIPAKPSRLSFRRKPRSKGNRSVP